VTNFHVALTNATARQQPATGETGWFVVGNRSLAPQLLLDGGEIEREKTLLVPACSRRRKRTMSLMTDYII
jgi:hypothetical protein